MYRTILVALVMTLALVTVAPASGASEPECLQVYPWSEVCNGNATPMDVVCYFVDRDSNGDCIAIQE